MKKLFRDNRGSSLLLVIIAVVFIGVLGMTVVTGTMTNIQMKQVAAEAQKNFYDADAVIDRIKSGLGKQASDAAKNAYKEYLENYGTYSDAEEAQKEFARIFLNKLGVVLCGDVVQSGIGFQYDTKVIKGLLKASADGSLPDLSICYREPVSPVMVINEEKGYLTLKEIVIEVNQNSYSTKIQTDIKMYAPTIYLQTNFGIHSELTSYSLIADNKINVSNNVTVNGSIYSGTVKRDESGMYYGSSQEDSLAGVDIKNGKLIFNGKYLISRGDILVSQKGKLIAGNEVSNHAANIWVENIRTGKDNLGSNIEIYGICNVEDDLEINGTNDSVTLMGEYYGYHYSKEESVDTVERTAGYSSSILINGKKATLNMEKLNKLILSGRTFISRKGANSSGESFGTNKDIMMGESLAVRSDQMAYYVPGKFVDDTSQFLVTEYEEYVGFKNFEGVNEEDTLSDYLVTDAPVTPYYLTGGQKYYYLNFINEEKANKFYENYYNLHKEEVDRSGARYLSDAGIQINKNAIFWLSGKILHKDKGTKELSIKITDADPTEIPIELLKSYALSKAREYRSRQLVLEKSAAQFGGATARLENKKENPLFERLIDVNKLDALHGGRVSYAINSDKENVWIADCDVVWEEDGGKGIIVSSGDVTLKKSFEGLIIAAGDINLVGDNGDGITLKDGQLYVKGLFNRDTEGSFSDYFLDFSKNDSGSGSESVNYNDYIYYENWRKN